jgi:hypothetical protein
VSRTETIGARHRLELTHHLVVLVLQHVAVVGIGPGVVLEPA